MAVGRDLLFATTRNGTTLLHLAAVTGQLETARLLVAAGNKTLLLATDNGGTTALHHAYEQAAVALLLVDTGGEELLFTQCMKGTAALHVAAAAGHTETARVLATSGGKALLHLKEHTTGYTALHDAAFGGHEAAVKPLIAVGGEDLVLEPAHGGEMAWATAMLGGHFGIEWLLHEAEAFGLSESFFSASAARRRLNH